MSDTSQTGRQTERESAYERHLDRSERVWDRWSDRYSRSERDYAPMLDDAVERLNVEAGDAVLEIGCGPGTNFERLHEQVGPDGRIVAVDYSPEMVERARERATEHGLDNVDVIRADAASVAFDPGQFDAAFASLSMSVMPDIEAAARRVRDTLVPGARFVVFDVRCFPSGPLRVLNPLLSRFFQWYANWNAEGDVLAALATAFDDYEVVETYFAGMNYTATTARLPASERRQ